MKIIASPVEDFCSSSHSHWCHVISN